jgi:hypothetical protein
LVTERLAQLSSQMQEDFDGKALPSHLKSDFQSHVGGMATLTFLDLCKELNLIKKNTAPKTIFLIVVIVAFIDEMHLALSGGSSQ